MYKCIPLQKQFNTFPYFRVLDTHSHASEGESLSLSSRQTRKHCCGNIMFPVNVSLFSLSENIVAETKFASKEAKMFPNKFRNIFVAETMFPSCPHVFKCFQHENYCIPD